MVLMAKFLNVWSGAFWLDKNTFCFFQMLGFLISKIQFATCSCLDAEICICFRIRITLSRSARQIQMSASNEKLQKAVQRAPVPAQETQAADKGLVEGVVRRRVERSHSRPSERTGFEKINLISPEDSATSARHNVERNSNPIFQSGALFSAVHSLEDFGRSWMYTFDESQSQTVLIFYH